MDPSFTEAYCKADHCTYYEPHPTNRDKCLCAHEDKPSYMDVDACPLYRLDWKKSAKPAPPPKPSRRLGRRRR